MNIIASVKEFLTLGTIQERSFTLAEPFDEPPMPDQIAAIWNRRARGGPWRRASVTDALGVPAIFGAVNMIANLTGSLSMKALRDEVELPPDQRPRVIVRPDPFTIPREFFRSTAYNLASRGEAWWWAAKRDRDGLPISILNVSPLEVQVEENPKDLRYPIIRWRDKVMDNDDFKPLFYSREPGSLRGVGPLQMCGAAISVAVESQMWAANFFAGGNSAIWIKTSIPLSGGDGDEDADDETSLSEVQRFKEQWMSMSPNEPRVSDDTIEDIKALQFTSEGAQMLEARAHQNVEVATMFNMDAELLNAVVAGSSLTYQNIGGRFDGFVRMCLRPNYLEVMEQTMSDFLTRSTVARFNTDSLTLQDPKTRWEVYNLAIPVLGQEEAAAIAREGEGLVSGDVENAPVPFSPPQAIPTAAAVQSRSLEVRCDAVITKRRAGVMKLEACGKLLSTDGTRPSWCPRCKTVFHAA